MGNYKEGHWLERIYKLNDHCWRNSHLKFTFHSNNLQHTVCYTTVSQQQLQQISSGRSRKQSNCKIIKLKLLLTGYKRANRPSVANYDKQMYNSKLYCDITHTESTKCRKRNRAEGEEKYNVCCNMCFKL